MTSTTPAGGPAAEPGDDATLALLVPPRSRRRRRAAIILGIAVLASTVAVTSWWPGVTYAGLTYIEADGSTAPDSAGSTSVFILERPGPDVPVSLESLEAPLGWRIVRAGVAAPSADIHVDAAPEDLTPLPARLVDRSRVVVTWEVDCPAALRLVREHPETLSTSWEDVGEDPAGTTLRLRPMTAVARLEVLGFLPASLGTRPDGTWVTRTPSLDLAEECAQSQEQVRELRGDVG